MLSNISNSNLNLNLGSGAIKITVSEAAKAHYLKLLQQNPGAVGIRLFTKKAGCSGLMYQSELIYEQGFLINQSKIKEQEVVKKSSCQAEVEPEIKAEKEIESQSGDRVHQDSLKSEQNSEDFLVFDEERIKIFVSRKSIPYLNGICIDFTQKMLGQSQVVYQNPNEVARCGCGESFKVKD